MKKRRVFSNNDNSTKYGEFVCSEFSWLPLDKQKENAKRLENLTDEINDESDE